MESVQLRVLDCARTLSSSTTLCRSDRTNRDAPRSSRHTSDDASNARIFVCRSWRSTAAGSFACSIFRSLRMKNSSSSSCGMPAIAFCVATQNDRGFQRVADQFFLARLLDRLADDAAQFQQLGRPAR